MNSDEISHSTTHIHVSISNSTNHTATCTTPSSHTHQQTQHNSIRTTNLDPRSPTALLSPAIEQNHPIGDNISEKDPSSLRFVLQNPNGLSYNEGCFEYQLCLEQMNSVSADVILLSETNLLWKDYNVFKQTTDHRRNLFSHSRQNTCFSAKHYGSPYQPGGTCSVLMNSIVGHYHSSQKDSLLGRWNIINLNVAGGKVLSVICCYQTCHNSTTTAGPKTFFMQQWSLLRDQNITNPRPRQQFYRDLDTVLSTLRRNGNSIVLAGDFNESLGDGDGLDRIVIKHGLLDCIAHRHGPYTTTTYSRGSKCLDYIFVSDDIASSIQRCGILPFDEIFTSDHRAIYLDLDPKTAVGTDLSPLWSPASRRLHSKNTDLRDKYIGHLTTMLTSHNVFNRIARLEQFCRTIPGYPSPDEQVDTSPDNIPESTPP